MFYNQPLATRFGTDLVRHVDRRIDPYWDRIDIAVAWVRASGMSYLSGELIRFLQGGGEISAIVGIDLHNTTREGLAALLDLEQHGRCETYVYHNEAQSVFHPKLYLFRNEEEARLIVASNNITESGLYVNVEAGLQVDTSVDADVILQAVNALESWKDTNSGLAMRLTADLLDRLRQENYVLDEATARARIRRGQQRSSATGNQPIFGSRRFVPPGGGRDVVQSASSTGQSGGGIQPAVQASRAATPIGSVLLMRLRKARRTQTQLPFRVFNAFFAPTTVVRNTITGEEHTISRASAHGRRNTMKLEMPEVLNFTQPVARFERHPDGIIYEFFDVNSPEGEQIFTALQQGREEGVTQTSISDAERATWWRFI